MAKASKVIAKAITLADEKCIEVKVVNMNANK